MNNDKDEIYGIEAEPVSNKYIVTFINESMAEDKHSHARVIKVTAPDHITAIQYAQRIDMASRAEVMADWLPPDDLIKPLLNANEDGYITIDNLRKLLEEFYERDVFKSFMMEDYKAIQVAAEEDVDSLNDEAMQMIATEISNVGDEAEEFLRKEGDDTT